MRLLDTVTLIGALNTGSRHHAESVIHLEELREGGETRVPMVVLLEADLVMKTRGYSAEERRLTWRAFEGWISADKVVSNTVTSLRDAVALQDRGLDYFDSLIASLAIETGATVVTTDRALRDVVSTDW
ncbi:MAG: PIN domain-containing protein [Candidatus Bathyarchaeota archaeon]